MYNPDSDETFLDLNDPEKVWKLMKQDQAPAQTIKSTTYLTEVNIPDWEDQLEKEFTEYEAKEVGIEKYIPLDKFSTGEFGIRWCNLKYVFRMLHAMIKAHLEAKPQLVVRRDGSKLQKQSLPQVSRAGIDGVTMRDNLNGKIESRRHKDRSLLSETDILQTAPGFDQKLSFGPSKVPRVSLRQQFTVSNLNK